MLVPMTLGPLASARAEHKQKPLLLASVASLLRTVSGSLSTRRVNSAVWSPQLVSRRTLDRGRSQRSDSRAQAGDLNPDLVARDEEAKPYTVRYDAVNAMLLNEFLKEHRKIELQDRKAQEQQNEIDTLKEELKAQKSLIQKESAQVELKKSAPQTVLNNQ